MQFSRLILTRLMDVCFSLYFADNTASVLTKRGGFRRREQPVYRLPVLIVDSGSPALSSTNTLSVRVCDCDSDGVALSCGAVAYTATGLSTGALLAILGCIITLLGKICMTSASETDEWKYHLQNVLKVSTVHSTEYYIILSTIVSLSKCVPELAHRLCSICLSGSENIYVTTFAVQI